MDNLYCNWQSNSLGGYSCSSCGVSRQSIRNRLCSGPTPTTLPKTKCKFLLEQNGEERIQCSTCKGRVLIKYPINSCSIFGKCLPTYYPNTITNEVNGCKVCASCPQKILVPVD